VDRSWGSGLRIPTPIAKRLRTGRAGGKSALDLPFSDSRRWGTLRGTLKKGGIMRRIDLGVFESAGNEIGDLVSLAVFLGPELQRPGGAERAAAVMPRKASSGSEPAVRPKRARPAQDAGLAARPPGRAACDAVSVYQST
jgi:hypothetical protein